MTVGFEGSADAVVKTAAAHEVLAIRAREDDLEDIFLRYYRADRSRSELAVNRYRRPSACDCRAHPVGGHRANRGDDRRRGAVPAVGHSIGKLGTFPPERVEPVGRRGLRHHHRLVPQRDRPSSMAHSVIGALAVTGAAATTAGEEEDRILGLVLAYPIRRSRLVAAKATAIAAGRGSQAFATLDRSDRRRGRRRRRNHGLRT